MARRGDGLALRGKTWWLDFWHSGVRHRVRIGKNVNRTVTGEIAAVKRAGIPKGKAGIDRKWKDVSYETARDQFLEWAKANKKVGTATFYGYCFGRLDQSFKGKMLSQIHPFLIEKHKQARLQEGHKVAVNRELATLSALFNRVIEWGKLDGSNPVKKIKRISEPFEPASVSHARGRG
jgi:hypothetical protein